MVCVRGGGACSGVFLRSGHPLKTPAVGEAEIVCCVGGYGNFFLAGGGGRRGVVGGGAQGVGNVNRQFLPAVGGGGSVNLVPAGDCVEWSLILLAFCVRRGGCVW